MRRRERGFSLIEMTVTLAIVSLLMLIVYSMIDQTVRVTMFNESHNDLAIVSQKGVNSISTELLQTRLVFQENALGQSYRAALQLSPRYPVWTDSLLPVIQAGTGIAPDTTTRFTGNSLLVARQLEPVSITYDHDNNVNTAEIEFLADVYRFEYVYLTSSPSPAFSNSGRSLDLVMSKSITYADYFQLSAMGAFTGRIVTKLIARGLTRAWDPGQPLASAFYALSGATDNTFDAAINNPAIALAEAKTVLPGLRGGHISGKMVFSVAFVPTSPQPAYPLRLPIRLYAPADATRPGFPSGFEVKIAGPAGNRQVMTRLVLMSHYGARHYESQQAFAITAGKF
ncbi:MAG TPA: prepilin-type N-terminal cleavage/methylation domain-containing protein [Thermoanaerobaculia bacterium]|nr:prepilin-type N-terminal cleavage/methylation domain-containing protein [Thermoanaerobaculia bacterium]